VGLGVGGVGGDLCDLVICRACQSWLGAGGRRCAGRQVADEAGQVVDGPAQP